MKVNDDFTFDKTNMNILKIVKKYADKHKDCWGIDEYVHQDDKAMIDAIDLFSEIIGSLGGEEAK
jgi:hypothetical protein